jgi:hypothetical protein
MYELYMAGNRKFGARAEGYGLISAKPATVAAPAAAAVGVG